MNMVETFTICERYKGEYDEKKVTRLSGWVWKIIARDRPYDNKKTVVITCRRLYKS